MAAESHYQNGNTGAAQVLVDEIRTRAGMPPVSLSSVNDIFNERRLELACEGHRFFDLIRAGNAQDYIEGFQTNKHELFPIPTLEIDLAGGNWSQNNGY